MIVGDWSDRCNLKYISTPCLGFKRMLKKRFDTYQINEHNTSQIHHKTHEKMENFTIKSNKKTIKMHSVLTFKMSNDRMGCINRDLNAVRNFKNIVDSLIETKKRPSYLSKKSDSVSAKKDCSKKSKLLRCRKTESPSAIKHKLAFDENERVQIGVKRSNQKIYFLKKYT